MKLNIRHTYKMSGGVEKRNNIVKKKKERNIKKHKFITVGSHSLKIFLN